MEAGLSRPGSLDPAFMDSLEPMVSMGSLGDPPMGTPGFRPREPGLHGKYMDKSRVFGNPDFGKK
jgi:hypothetical protein